MSTIPTAHEADPSNPDATGVADAVEPPELPLLDMPADGLPDVVADERELMRAAEAMAAGTGPVAIDAERASGYRYGQRAYLVQLRRAGTGTLLVDPVALPDLRPLDEAIGDAEWVLHAATQDLPCLAELGMHPRRLFDTELGARLVGLPRVGLAAAVEHYLGLHLAKEHSAVDWSTRPLPEPWLRYAALDVEVLVALRDAVAADLRAQGKDEWARQEFDHLLDFTGPGPRLDPWRRTSGIHKVRGRRPTARVRSLWYARDDLARRRDVSPGRIVPDAVLLQIAVADPSTQAELLEVSPHKAVRRHADVWLKALAETASLPEASLPPAHTPSDAPPPPRAWADREPDAALRLQDARAALTSFSEVHHVPVENLLSPDTLRRTLWPPTAPEPTESAVREALARREARPWQIDIAAPIIVDAMRAHPGSSRG